MTRNKVIVLSDGTRCYSGPNCRKHGTAAANLQISTMQTRIDNLFEKEATGTLPELEEKSYPWWEDYHEEAYQQIVTFLKPFGMKESKVVTWHEVAARNMYVEVPTGDPETQLIVGNDDKSYQQYDPEDKKRYMRAWMFKNNQPVAMLRFSAYPDGYTPPEGKYPHVESAICDIEVKEEHRGNKYGLEIIKHVEASVLNGRKIHSGGSYTPEGQKYLGGHLPYTDYAKKIYSKEIDAGLTPKSSFSSMNFVHDWDKLQKTL